MYETQEQERRRNTGSQDEIDLVTVYKGIRKLFQRIGNSFKYLFKVIINNILAILMFVAVGAAVGYGAYKVTKPYYISSMTLVLSDIRNEFVENQLTSLTELVQEDNVGTMAQYLDISEDHARQIKEMEFTNLDQDRIAEDSVLVGSPFRIELTLYDNSAFEVLEPALVNFLESNRYFTKQKQIRQREVESLISKYKEEISSIDSVKTTVISPRGPVNGFVYGEPIDPTNLYRESINMYQQQVQLEAELDRLDNIEIVNGFTPRLNPTGPNLLKFVAIGAIVAFLIGVIFVLNLESKKRRKLSF